jgi:hypothetical protein
MTTDSMDIARTRTVFIVAAGRIFGGHSVSGILINYDGINGPFFIVVLYVAVFRNVMPAFNEDLLF